MGAEVKNNFFIIDNELIDRDDLKPLERLIYICLSRFADYNTKTCYPNEETLLRITGIKDKRTLRTWISNLEEKNLIEVIREKGKSNFYKLKAVTKNATTSEKAGTKIDTTLIDKKAVTKNDTSDNFCTEVVTKNATTSSDKNCHSNNTINNTIKQYDSQTDRHEEAIPVRNLKNEPIPVRKFESSVYKKSLTEFLGKLFNQGLRFSKSEIEQMIEYCERLKLQPMDNYVKSRYLQGSSGLALTRRMFNRYETWEKISLGDYNDNIKSGKKEMSAAEKWLRENGGI